MESKGYNGHVLVVPFPTQGHINPMLQFSKRLLSKGIKATLAITLFIYKSINHESSASVQIDTISDGCDQGGFAEADGVQDYIKRLETVGSKTLAELILKHKESSNPVDCIAYDAAMPWALDVAKQFGLITAPFFTQMCAVDYIYYNVHHGLLSLPVSSTPVSLPGLPLLEHGDLPSFLCSSEGSYAAYLKRALNQFSNLDKADCILVNTFYNLEDEVVDSMSKVCPLLTIGPTVPSIYLDKRIPDDKNYGVNLFTLDYSTSINWLSSKPPGSVIYVAFGSVTCLNNEQMEEVAWGLKQSNCYFLWVVRATEEEKLPKEFKEETVDKGLIVNWSPQLEVLSNEAVGCFLTHSGWNSTTEALSLGVPMVAMPQWTDQPTNAKFVEDIWKMGVRVKANNDGIASREQIASCIMQVMEGARGREMKENAKKWRDLAVEAMSKGGSSDKNIDEFVSKLTDKNLADN
ncbi:UDP-glycosyltransferase 74F2-like [Durio zibethinus]|uniref:Glycosyltransferase n=1 Tax=Durio zibethinus TaxID=66656 RepID=A0A6P5X2P0_DURZI|nr:UDP-glycosyltransferase 74F2-like [Durio zibethinus]